jgi:hypothetical protein
MIFAIDPGTDESAYVVYDGCAVREWGKVENRDLLAKVRDPKYRGCRFIVEMIASYGMPVGRETFETCVWIGRFIEACPNPIERVFRKTVVGYFCNDAKAKDTNIRAVMLDIVGPQGTKRDPGPTYGISKDGWSALAVAVYAHETHRTPARARIAELKGERA